MFHQLFALQNNKGKKNDQRLLKDDIICFDDVQGIWIIYNLLLETNQCVFPLSMHH